MHFARLRTDPAQTPEEGEEMSVAKRVSDVERTTLNWLKIDDEDGNVWRYGKRGNIISDVIHLECEYFGKASIRATLLRDEDGKPVLRQEEPGLPREIVVEYITPAGSGAGVALCAGTVKYEKEDRDWAKS